MTATNSLQLRSIPTADLEANPRNVRERLDGIDELAASIRANGLLQPLIVNDRAGTLVVTDGHRRLEAARRAGIPRLMCLVSTDADDRSVVTTMLAAAMHRELQPVEQARAFDRLTREGVTRAEIARTTGYSVATISQRLLLLSLPVEQQRMVDQDEMTLGQATQVAKLVKARTSGTVTAGSAKSAWLTPSHRLALAVQESCDHHDRRTVVGNVGCGQCWEAAIRADERGELDAPAPYDEVLVERVLSGERLTLSRADRLEAVRRLHGRRWSDGRIALQLDCTARQVLRDRQALDLPGVDQHGQEQSA